MTTHAIKPLKPRLSEHEVTQMVQRAGRRHEIRVTLVAAMVTGGAFDDTDAGNYARFIRVADAIIDALEKRHAEERKGL